MQFNERIIALCVSTAKGIAKNETDGVVLIKNHGIEGDAHAGNHHRQVSLLSFEKADEFRRRGAEVRHGSFGENLVVSGFGLSGLAVGTVLKAGTAQLRITQIGKECHHDCAVFQTMGDCIMPREGVFAEVIRSGTIKKGDGIVSFEI